MKKISLTLAGIISISLLITAPNIHAETKKISVVSLSPCLTEIIFQLGKGACLVGRSSACDYPEDALKIPVVGAFGKPSIEKIIEIKPDVVVATDLADPAVQKSIEQFGIRFFILPEKSISAYYQTVQKLGDILGCPDQAAAEIARIRDGLQKLTKLNNGLEHRPKVYMEIWHQPYMTVGKKSFINDMIKYAGGANIAGELDKDYFNCSEEWIIKSDPQIIICPGMKKGNIANIAARNGWKNISAVKNKQIYVELNQNLIFRLGPKLLEGIELLHSVIAQSASPAKEKNIEK